MFEDIILNPTFLMYCAVTAGGVAVVLFSLSRHITETPVQIVAVERRTKPKPQRDTEKEELQKKVAELEEKVSTLDVINKLAPEEKEKRPKTKNSSSPSE